MKTKKRKNFHLGVNKQKKKHLEGFSRILKKFHFLHYLSGAGILLAGVVCLLSLTSAAPSPVTWVETTSTNCLTQGAGNTMLEADNGYIYVLFGGSSSFRRYNPATGNCDATSLASFPYTTTAAGSELVQIDENTLMASAGNFSQNIYYYSIPNNSWTFYYRSKANDTVNSPPIPELTVSPPGLGNSILAIGNKLYMIKGGGSRDFYVYSHATNSWTQLANLPVSATSGASMATAGEYLYATVGSTAAAYRYCLTPTNCTTYGNQTYNTWTTLGTATATFQAGASLAVVGNYLYAIEGYNRSFMWKYNITQSPPGTWTNLPYLPDLVFGGGAMTAVGTNLYILQGNNTTDFWRFDTVTETVTEMSDTPDRVSAGGSLTTDGTNIYATKGRSTTEFWKYTVATDTWSSLKQPQVGPGPGTGWTGSYYLTMARGGITYMADGPSGQPQIYLATGMGTVSSCSSSCVATILRYRISDGTWPAFENFLAPSTFGYGGAMVHPDGSDYVYGIRGIGQNSFWKFMISKRLWIPWNRGKLANDEPITQGNDDCGSSWCDYTQGHGNQVIEMGGKIYTLKGDNSRVIDEYDPVANLRKDLVTAPYALSTNGGDGSFVAYDEDTIFVIGTGIGFMRYDIPSGSWYGFNIGKTTEGVPFSQLDFHNGQGMNASNLTQSIGTTMAEYNGQFYVIPGGTSRVFLKFDPAKNRWTQTWDVPAASATSGNAMVTVGTNIYVALGGVTTFYRYVPVQNAWAGAAAAPLAFGAGASLANPSGTNYIYALRGANSTGFFRFDTGGNAWTDLSATMPTPTNVQGGGALTALNSTTLYAMRGNNTNEFWRFDITNLPSAGDGTWTDLTATDPTPLAVQSGGSLVNDGTYVYALAGGNRKDFWRFDPSQPAGSRWSTISSSPYNMGATTAYTTTQGGMAYSPTLGDIYAVPGNGIGNYQGNPGAGPGLIYRYQLPPSSGPAAEDYTWPHFTRTQNPPTTVGIGVSLVHPENSDYVYAMLGGNGREFNRYCVEDTGSGCTPNTWSSENALSDTPDTVYSGSFLTSAGSALYAFRGNNSNAFWRYDIGFGWSLLANAPGTVGPGGSLAYDGVNDIYATRGSPSGTQTTNFWRYNIPNGRWNIAVDGPIPPPSPVPLGVTYTQDRGGITFQDPDGTPGTDDEIIWMTPGYGNSSVGDTLPVSSYTPAGLLYRFEVGNNVWTTFNEAKDVVEGATTAAFYGGSDLAVSNDNNSIYALQGNSSTPRLWHYSIPDDIWTLKNPPLSTIQSGGALTAVGTDNNSLYATRGNNTNTVYRYDILLNTWSSLPHLLLPVNMGAATQTDDKGEMIYSPSTFQLFATTGNDTLTPFSIYSFAVVNRAFPTPNPANPSVNTDFAVTVQSIGPDGAVAAVTQDTNVVLTLKTGTGALTGTLTGTILSGNSEVIISGVRYNTAETGVVITAASTSGDNLSPVDSDPFNVTAAPTITNVTPNEGPMMGGTAITVTGTNFVAGATVKIANIAATCDPITEPTTINCTTAGSGAEGWYDVVVTNPDLSSATLTDGFHYLAYPILINIDPVTGPTTGGTPFTISGQYIFNGATVTFDGIEAIGPYTYNGGISVAAITPPHAAGVVDVVVTNPAPDGASTTMVGAFTYSFVDPCSNLDPNQVCGSQTIECPTKSTSFVSFPDNFQLSENGNRYIRNINDIAFVPTDNSGYFEETAPGIFTDPTDTLTINSNTPFPCGGVANAVSLTVSATPFITGGGDLMHNYGLDLLLDNPAFSGDDYAAMFSVITSEPMSCSGTCTLASGSVESLNEQKNGQNNYFAAEQGETPNAVGFDPNSLLVGNDNTTNTVTLYQASQGFYGDLTVPGLDFNLSLPANLHATGSYSSTVTYTLS